jgi:Leucine-rich repeat (LRR) protein
LDLSFNTACAGPAACAGMKKLKVLNLSYCDIKELPAELGAMEDLESLDLSGIRNLHNFLPAACAGMKKLKVLNLRYCDIKELPSELGAMDDLESLDLSFNKNLHNFPPAACGCNEKVESLES